MATLGLFVWQRTPGALPTTQNTRDAMPPQKKSNFFGHSGVSKVRYPGLLILS